MTQVKHKKKIILTILTTFFIVICLCLTVIYYLWNPPILSKPHVSRLVTNIYDSNNKVYKNTIKIKNFKNRTIYLERFTNNKWEHIKNIKATNEKITIIYPKSEKIYTTYRIVIPEFQYYFTKYKKETISIKKITCNVTNPRIHSNFASVIDENNNEIYKKSSHAEQEIGSITKLMTYLVANEKTNPQNTAIYSEIAANTDYPSLENAEGDTFTMENLYKAMLVESSNDAATAIAENAAGSVNLFVDLMNRKAGKLELKQSTFKNPHGLDEERQLSSAYDASVLMKECFKSKLFRDIDKENADHITSESGTIYPIETTNMLENNKKIKAWKTGTTDRAGFCLSFVYRYKNNNYYVTTLRGSKEEDRWTDAYKLINYIRDEGVI